LTVLLGKSGSHFDLGWQEFTSGILKLLDQKLKTPIVYLAWGRSAMDVLERAGVCVAGKPSGKNRLVLSCPHPSPYSANTGFFGSKHFSKTNEFLKKHNCEPIDWKVV
jgi:uracil-DNA glycosylase